MRHDRPALTLAAVVAVLCVLITGCTVPGGPRPQPQASTPGQPADAPVECTLTLEQGGDAKVELGENTGWDEVQKDIKKAERYVDGFWQRHWDQCFADADYRAPEKRGVFTDDDPVRCDGTTIEDDNALYCPDGHFVAYGRKLMRRTQESDAGVQWAYLVVAHEWGHAVQQLLADGGYDDLVPNPLEGKRELQADCLAAAALWGSDHEGFLEWDSEDDIKVAEDLLALDDTPWTKVTPDGEVRTGGPLARIAAFQAGLGAEGVRNCFSAYR